MIRRSSIEDYKSCPYYFKLHVIDGNEPRQNVLARLGSDLHDLYEHIQRGDVSIEEMESQLDWIMSHIEEDYPEEDMQRVWERARTCNNSFINLLPTLTNKAIQYEERINFSIGKDIPQVTIAYDRLEEDENGEPIYDEVEHHRGDKKFTKKELVEIKTFDDAIEYLSK